MRLYREAFYLLCDELRPLIRQQVIGFRESISVEVRVQVTLWRLATNVEYCTIAAMFELGKIHCW